MNYLLCLIIFILLILNLIAGKRILFPGTIVCTVFFLSSLLVVLNTKDWNYIISWQTFLVIVISLVLFSAGALLGKRIVIRKTVNIFATDGRSRWSMPKGLTMLMSIFAMGIDLLYLLHQYCLAKTLGNTGGILGMFGTLRKNMKVEADLYGLSIPMNIGISFVRALGYISLYLLISKLVDRDKRSAKRYILPILCLLLCEIISTSRIGIITFVAAGFFDFYISRRKKGNDSDKNFVKYGIGIFVVFFLAFYLLGKLTGQSNVYSAWETISMYAGASIVCLDDFIKGNGTSPDVFAQYSFKGINSLLRKIGFDIPSYSNHFPNVYFGTHGSNIYTALYPFIYDFGVIPAVLLQLFLGILFGFMWKKYYSQKGKSMLTVVYGRFFGYALCMYSIAERLCSEFLALNIFVEIFFYYIIISYAVVQEKKKNYC